MDLNCSILTDTQKLLAKTFNNEGIIPFTYWLTIFVFVFCFCKL
jgi:hypothetical protein